ncbi:hypothetical protein PPERSA_11600 [Pseudocohnilembus persalinus]|uniref:IQ motif, EF-hand binding site n=1 Tax=Pseudocohnilembus persalinus TaxID=266149 RepID=A0A0V0QA99_PSEPJ|nr:hypothetical protein PPERSA_11600 [Pseudocohnilembus persalinus]|eukprot:KRW98999.1 hypothetical protein PPERSA_11600 [Pseudocohnilembus persalinus]
MGNQKCIFNQTWRYFQLRNFATCRHLQEFNEQKFQDVKVYSYPIQYEYDSFFNKQLKSNKIIKNSLILWIYKRKQRSKYYSKHEKQVIMIQAFFRGQIIRNMTNLRPILDRIRFNSKAKYAIRIQRKWRQYVLKKKRQRLFKNLKYEDDELEDIDMDWINQEPEFDSGLQIPENFDVEAFITPNHLLEQAKQIPSKAYQSGYKNDQMGQINEEIEEEQKSQNQSQSQNKNQFQKFQKNSSDIFVESFSSAQGFNYKQQSLQGQNVFQNQGKRISEQEFDKIYQKMQYEKRKLKVTDEEEGQIMNDWGFKDPKVAKAMAQKIEKMRKLKYQKQQKNLTAEQKLAKFRAANKK